MRKGCYFCYKRVMSRNRLTFGYILIFFSVALSVSTQSAENGCINCHQQSDFFAQYPKLHEYYQQYLESPHKHAGVTCDDCHGGNASASSAKIAHVGVLPMSNKNSTVHYQKQPDTCGQCQRAAPTCTTCHPAMSRRPELRNIVLNACRNCHGEGNSENLPLIADQAESVFSQLNISNGLLGWTRIHFESHEWPDDSKERVRDLERRYQTIVNNVHQFDLQQTEDSTTEILVELRETLDATRRAYGQRSAEDPDGL